MSESNFDLTPTMPQVWYLDRAYEWHFLAPNFTTYFRMMIYHLGLPQWQLLFTPNGPTPWAKVRISIFSILEKTRRKRVKRLHSGTTSDKLILKFYQSTKG